MRGTLAIASALLLALAACTSTPSERWGGDYHAAPYVDAANIEQFMATYGYTQITNVRRVGAGWVSGGWAGSAVDRNGRPVDFTIDPYDIIHTTPR